MPQARLVAVADVIEERARTLADELEVGSWSTDDMPPFVYYILTLLAGIVMFRSG